MKTIKFIFSLLVSLMLVVPSWAQNDPSAEVYVRAENISAVLGEEVELPILLLNNVPVHSFEFNITLPNGVSFTKKGAGYMYTKVNRELEVWTIVNEQSGDENTAKVMGFYNSTSDLSLSSCEEELELLTLGLTVSEDANLTDAKIVISDQIFALDQEGSNEFSPELDEELFSSEIKAVTYPDGYAVKLMPFIVEDEETEQFLFVECQKDLTYIEFDITFSQKVKSNGLYDFGKINVTTATTVTEARPITITARPGKKISSGKNILKLTIYYDPEVLGNSVYTVFLTNITVTTVDGETINIAPYAADFFTGTNPVAPVENGVVAFHGDYSDGDMYDLMLAAIPSTDDKVTTLDLTAVTETPADANKNYDIANPNALIRTNVGFGAKNTQNVVEGKTCAKLVLEDKYPFVNTKKFTAAEATYSREMTDHSWGTLYLPFTANVGGAKIYTLKEVSLGDADTEGQMIFDQDASTIVEVNKPYVIKKTSNDVNFSAENIEVPATSEQGKEAQISGWSLTGTTTEINYASEDLSVRNIYFINGDHFWKAANELKIAPFRAYFESSKSAAKFRIAEETNGIETIENDAEAGVIYDLQGRAVKAAQAGQIYVQDAKKFVVK